MFEVTYILEADHTTKIYVQEEFSIFSPLQTSDWVVAPIAAPDAGIKKSLAGMRPSDPLAPFNLDGSTLLKVLLDQVPDCQEFPVALTVETRVTCTLPALTAAMLLLRLEEELRKLKPTSPLFQAVLRSTVSAPGLPLSMNPFFAFEKAMELRTMWLAGGLSVIPSLKPLPSPLKLEKPQRLNPLPQA